MSEVGNAEYGDNAAPASHIMHAARLLTVKTGKTGKYVSDFDVRLHTEDDGESRGGKAVGEALAAADAADVVVAVSRWFGGRPFSSTHLNFHSLCLFIQGACSALADSTTSKR